MKESIKQDDRRKYPRADINFKIRYHEDQRPEEVGGRNICAGGMAFETEQLLPVGLRLHLIFTVPGRSGEIRARGRVVRAWLEKDECMCAAEFFEIQSEDRELLAQLVANYVGKPALAV